MTERLAIFLPSLDGGGAERVMVMIANGIAARGFSVDLILANAKGPYISEVSDKVRIVDLQCSRILASLTKLSSYLRKERPVAMLSALRHANIIAVFARALSRIQTRLIISERNQVSAAFKPPMSFRLHIIKCLMRFAYARSDGIVAVSNGVAGDLAKYLKTGPEIEVIYNPVCIDSLERLASADVRHPWLMPDQLPVILGVGRLEPQKDFSTLLKAFALVTQTHSARLMILGEGKLETQLKAEASALGIIHLVDFPGFVENPYVYMSHAGVFVLSSAWEGLPNVLIQAMACGTPVVSTDCPSGPEEILENGRWGRIVPVGDHERLAKAIIESLDDRNPPEVMERARDFNVQSAIDAYLKVLLGK